MYCAQRGKLVQWLFWPTPRKPLVNTDNSAVRTPFKYLALWQILLHTHDEQDMEFQEALRQDKVAAALKIKTEALTPDQIDHAPSVASNPRSETLHDADGVQVVEGAVSEGGESVHNRPDESAQERREKFAASYERLLVWLGPF